MGKKKGILATIAIPAILLAGGAGVGLVLAKEPAPRESREASSAISAELAGQLRQAARAEAGRAQEAARKKKSRRPARKMTVARAEKNAEKSARRAWDNDWDDTPWDDYGTDGCNRLSRRSVTCVAWVEWMETGYGYEGSEYGSLYTCEWWVTSRWTKKSKRGKKARYRVKVADGRRRAACDYE